MTSIKTQLDQMLKRSLTLCGTAIDKEGKIVPKDAAVRDFLTTLAAATPDPKEQAQMIIDAWGDKTGNLQTALSALRVEQVGNFIAAESTFKSAFFNTVTLAPDEQPTVENTSKNEIRIGSLGEDGKPEQVRVVKSESNYNVGLSFITSDIVRVKTLDLYKGNVAAAANATFDIARDLRVKLDRLHYTLYTKAATLGGPFGLFSYEQVRTAKEQRIYVPHSVIVTSHLPTTNDIDLTSGNGESPAGTSTKFGVHVLKKIVDYAFKWGNLFPGGPLVPTGEIIVPSSDIVAIADDTTPSSNTATNDLQDQINQHGYAWLNWLGRTWKFIPDVTIASGTCFPRFNLLPGISYEKPGFDKEFSNLNNIENWEERWQRKVWGAVIINQYRIRALRIKYKA